MMPASSSRILYNVPCGVCRDNSSGKHYGVFACDGCAGFFKRSVRRERNYVCKARVPGSCTIDKIHRNQCRSCRLAKCLSAGMNKDAVQHERGPRNSTIRRQMALFSKDIIPSTDIGHPLNTQIPTSPTMPNPTLMPHSMPLALSLFTNSFTQFNGLNIFNTPSAIVPYARPLFSIRSNILHQDDPEKQCEVAARLLFLNVKWAKNLIPFETLSLPDRLLLLEESWAELFVLGLAEFLYPIDLDVIFDRGNARLERTHVDIFKSVLIEIAKVRPDTEEYMYLRSLILFKTNFSNAVDVVGRGSAQEMKRLQDLPTVAHVQNRVQAVLNIHTATTYPRELTRTSQLHHILTMLKTVSGQTIIELFFRNTIGDMTMEKIITDLYKSGRIPVIPLNI